MKFKTTAIAMAVAGSVAAPAVVQAGADELYASARVGIWNVDTGGDSNTAIRSFSSRFGAKGETDLGNGMSGFGRYEWDVDFNNDVDGGSEDDISVRHRYVGVKGDFGSVLLGQTYHTFYNFVVGPTDIPWWHSGYTMVDYRGRTDNGITYSGGTGAFAFGATLYFDADPDEDDPDQYEVGASIGLGDMTLGVAVSGVETTQGSAGTDDDIFGVALSGIGIGDTSLGIGIQTQDEDMSWLVDWVIGGIYIHVEQLLVDAGSAASVTGSDEDQLAITLGYTQSLGEKTTMYYEISDIDNDTGDSDDDRTAVMAVLKYDII